MKSQVPMSGIEGVMVLVGERCSMVSLSMSIDHSILMVSYMTGISTTRFEG